MYYKKSRTVLEIIFIQTTHVNIIGTDESQYSRIYILILNTKSNFLAGRMLGKMRLIHIYQVQVYKKTHHYNVLLAFCFNSRLWYLEIGIVSVVKSF